MKKSGRYDTSKLVEAQFEPGSQNRVLKNLPGIKRKREMDRLEKQEQLRVMEELIDIYDQNHRFTAGDICRIHKIWLGNIYEWAGKYRSTNISKGNFHFAAARHIPRLMDAFEKEYLLEYTPCRYNIINEIAKALAVVHVELVLIHPFREGNGRVTRLLSTLMAFQSGIPPLDFSGIVGRRKREYIGAIHSGMDNNYGPMEKIFRSIICKSSQTHGR